MMKNRHLWSALSALFLSFSLGAQTGNVGVGTTTPDPSAALDVKSTTQGMLVPRMTSAQRSAVAAPATGLLVFDTDSGSFWFHDGAAWVNLSAAQSVISDADGDTKIQVEKSPDEDIIRFDLAGTESMVLQKNQNGSPRLELTNVLNNTFIGLSAGNANTSGFENTAGGVKALSSNTTGFRNMASGFGALSSNTTGNNNTAIGYRALEDNTSGDDNTATGYEALEDNTTGYDNTAGGIRSLQLNTTGYRNTAFGRSTGSFNDANIHCTFIGYDSDQTVSTNFDNSTALGSFSRITASNQVRIGNANVTSIGGYAGWTDVSDGRFKKKPAG